MVEKQKKISAAWPRWLVLGLIFIAQLLVLLASPEEKTLGTGIKPVYLHVSLTWTGLLLLVAAAVTGLWGLFSGRAKTGKWQSWLLNSGFGIYLVGFFVSMYASVINWGGVPFNEPAVRLAAGYLVVGVILWGATRWMQHIRLKALVGLLAAGMMLLATKSSQSILHPESPVNTSPASIKLTFYLMFALGLILAAWSLRFQQILGTQHE